MTKRFPDDFINKDVVWKVTTEGDERSTRLLGYYRGTIENIAMHLANQAMYELHFIPVSELVNHITEFKPTRDYARVSIAAKKGFDADNQINKICENTSVYSKINESYGSTKFTLKIKNHQQFLREQALAKLTEEDKIALGLKIE